MSLEILTGEVVGVGGIKRPKFAKESIRLKMQFLAGWGVLGNSPRGEYGGLRWVGLPTPSFHTGGSVYVSG